MLQSIDASLRISRQFLGPPKKRARMGGRQM
jgi:hypothetical protein